MKTPEQFVNEECAVYNAEALIAAVKARDAEVRAECAKAAVAAVNDCRADGESDFQSTRAWVEQAILDPAGYTVERAEMVEAIR